MTDPSKSADLQHFLQHANTDCVAPIDIAARELSDCIVNHVPDLDEAALRGMCFFAGYAMLAPDTARQMLQE